MNVLNLTHALDITCVAGQTLSMEETFMVQNALLILQGENHFQHIYFFGKIFGIERDYYLAFGYRQDAIRGRYFFYSNNQHDWFVLSEPSTCSFKLAPRVSHRFTGDPSHVVDWRDAGDTFSVTGRECQLKEEDRLAAVTYALHEECAIAPKGVFSQNIQGLWEINPIFQGLSLKEGSDAAMWVNSKIKGDSPMSSGDYIHEIADLKADQWSFRIRAQGSVCVVLSLEWLGLVAYHRLRTPEHGFVYFGDGMKAGREIEIRMVLPI